jgi:hypothetical protein
MPHSSRGTNYIRIVIHLHYIRNYKFITSGNHDELAQRMKGWMDLFDKQEDIDFEKLRGTVVSEEHLRIFRRDAERTYVPKDDKEVEKRTKERQDMHVENLRLVVAEVGDYHQGLGYIAAFLGLFSESDDVVRIALALHRNEKYSAGYFMGAPQRFLADAKTFYIILEKTKPELLNHLKSKGVLPEMFASKWFVGLCLHVLPYSALFEFYENYLTHGGEYLFKFAMEYMNTFESQLMECTSTSELMTILRAEDDRADWKLPPALHEMHVKDNIFDKIVAGALSVEFGFDIESIRSKQRAEVAEAVTKALKRDQELKDMYSDDEIVFSDEE